MNRGSATGDVGESSNRVLLRDAALLQLKLVVDGLRDFLLVPASIVAAVLSLVSGKDGRPGTQFYDLLELGKRSEHWINLFGTPSSTAEVPSEDRNLDDVVGRMEAFLVDEYRKGGVTRQAKERIDQALAALNKKR